MPLLTEPQSFRSGDPPLAKTCLHSPKALALSREHAESFGQLLVLLHACEASAVAVFNYLATSPAIDPTTAVLFADIQRDECRHEALLATLLTQLPPVDSDPRMRRAALRFLSRIQARDPIRHALRIAFLDAAVCRILSMLLQPGLPLREDAVCRTILTAIWRDESRHAAVTSRFAFPRFDKQTLHDEFFWVRNNLIGVLKLRAAAIAQLGVDFDHLCNILLTTPHPLRQTTQQEIAP